MRNLSDIPRDASRIAKGPQGFPHHLTFRRARAFMSVFPYIDTDLSHQAAEDIIAVVHKSPIVAGFFSNRIMHPCNLAVV